MGDYISSLNVLSAWPHEELQMVLPVTPLLSSTPLQIRFPSTLYNTFIDDEYFADEKLMYVDSLAVTSYIPSLDVQTYSSYPASLGNTLTWDVSADRTKLDFRLIEGTLDEDDIRRGFIVLPSCVIPETTTVNASSIQISSCLSSPTAIEYDQPQGDYTTLDFWEEYADNIGPLSELPYEPTYLKYGRPYVVSKQSTTYTVPSVATTVTITLPAPIEMGSIQVECPYVSGSHIGDRGFWSGYGTDGTNHKILYGDYTALYVDAIDFSANYTTGVVVFNFLNGTYVVPGMEIDLSYNVILSSVAGYDPDYSLSAYSPKASADVVFDTWYHSNTHDTLNVETTAIPAYLFRYPVYVSTNSLTTFEPANDLYTLAYEVSAQSIKTDLSSYQITPYYIDNYGRSSVLPPQDTFTVVRYSSELEGLSGTTLAGAYNLASPSWLDGSESQITVFDNRFGSKTGTVLVEVSSVTQEEYFSKQIPVGLNADLAPIVIYTLDSTNDTVTLSVISDTIIPPATNVIWSVSPPDNIVITSIDTGVAVPLDTAVPYSSASYIIVSNLGIDTTIFTFSAAGYTNTARTFWVPSSYNNISLQIGPTGSLDNEPFTRTLPIQAKIYKNGLPYSLSNASTVQWDAEHNSGSIWGTNLSANDFDFGYFLPSSTHKAITANIETPEVVSNPDLITFTINSTVRSSFYELNSNLLPVVVDEFPSADAKPIYFDVLATTVNPSGIWITDSDEGEDILREIGTYTFTLSANDAIGVPASSYVWSINGVEVSAGVKVIDVAFTASAPCISSVEMCAENVIANTWPYTHTICDSINFNFVSAYEVLDADVFPSWVFSPAPQKLTYENYITASRGATAYGEGHVEFFNLSCTPQFTAYEVTLDNLVGDYNEVFTSTTNRITFDVLSADMGVYPIGTTISVRGYNKYYTPRIPDTFIGDDGSTVELSSYVETPLIQTDKTWHNVKYVSYETLSASVSTDPEIDASVDQGYFPVTTVFTNPNAFSPVVLADNSTCVIIISSDAWVDSSTYEFTPELGTQNFYAFYQTTDPAASEFIPNDVVTSITVRVSGTGYRFIDHLPSGPWYQSAQSFDTSIQANAYPSLLDLEVFNNQQIGRTGEVVTFSNVTQFLDFSASDFSAYYWDFGNGVTGSTNDIEMLTATYLSAGTYFTSFTAVKNGGETTVREFGPVLMMEDEPDGYTDDIVRQFNNDLVLPYECGDISVANRLTKADTINSAIRKLYANFEYLKNNSKAYNGLMPFALDSWFGQTIPSGCARWHSYDKDAYKSTRTGTSVISDVKDALIAERYNQGIFTLMINGKTIEIYQNSDKMATIADVAPNDPFIAPCRIGITSNQKVIIADKGSRNIYAFDFDFDDPTVLTVAYYIGGLGDREDPEGFATIDDMFIDGNDYIYITDSGNKQVKKFNESFGWVSSYTHPTMSRRILGAVADEDQNVYVVDEDRKLFVFDRAGELTNTVTLSEITGTIKGIDYTIQRGFINIITAKNVYKYSTSGSYIGEFSKLDFTNFELIKTNKHVIIDSDNTLTRGIVSHVISNRGIFAAVDYVERLDIRHTLFDDKFHSLESILVHKDEGNTDWVLNSSLFKLFINIDLLYRSIHSKYVVYTNPETNQSLLYTMRPLTLEEKEELALTCDHSLHLNEPVKDVVIKRIMSNYCRFLEDIKEMMQQTTEVFPCRGDICWSWASLKASVPQSRNCYRNPITGFELESAANTTLTKTWADANSVCCNQT